MAKNQRWGKGRTVTVALAGVALAGTAAVGVAQAAPATAHTAKVATCSASGLQVSLHSPLAGGMNHQGAVVQFKNTGSATCALLGYPGLGLENAQHKVLSSKVTWGSTWYAKNPGKKVVDLKPGQTAEAVIAWTHANTGTSGAQHAAYLEVTPPASTAHKTLKFDEWVDNGDLDATAVASTVPLNG
ncbi:DUF4232 domain-containing protein [Streptomyces sp. 8L]|uniref:DUF4232 domain-containing protein n=1 Tax=Streptomyces sp. 8L TaxID=2877242 RepID=UPI001CD6F72F|nr:DUF4232 domain-containing protein [Streptomyces sp. 8L]MCA1218659.1 DUF4232 domain-containing protein [Streptomyces sp. 8L]